MSALSETITSAATLYHGKILNLEKVETRTDSGRAASREIVRHRQAVVVLIEKPDGKLVFVRQYRVPMNDFLIEAVAGGMEPGETPEEAAKREAGEESGFNIENLQYLGKIASTPGFCDEILHCFYAKVYDSQGEQHPDADESLDVITFTRNEFLSKVKSGEIYDAKTLAAWAQYEISK